MCERADRRRTRTPRPGRGPTSRGWARTRLECHGCSNHRGEEVYSCGDSLTGMSAIDGVSEMFDPTAWDVVPGFENLTDLTYHRAKEHGTVGRLRPSGRPQRVPAADGRRAADGPRARADRRGRRVRAAHRQRPEREERQAAFCTGGDQRIRGKAGYQYEEHTDGRAAEPDRQGPAGRLHILECSG